MNTTATIETPKYHAKYWGKKGAHQTLADMLAKLIPQSGPCEDAKGKNKALDKFRRASNCYYDLFNNGLCNRAAEARQIFGFGAPRLWNKRIDFTHPSIERYDLAMDKIILAAAEEQRMEIFAPDYSI